MKSTYYIYIATNKNNSVLYIGVTNDIRRRMYEHKNKLTDGFTAKYNICKLIYIEEYSNITEAIAREKQLKGGSRMKKEELIGRFNPAWKDLDVS